MRGLVIAAIVSISSAAFAQGAGSQAEAQALFDAGRKLMEQGRFKEACPKLEASQKLDPGAGTLLNLASCYEKNGQTASAWVTYTDAATASTQSGHPDWAAKAKGKADALAPHLAKITITMASPPEGLELKRDGKPVAYAALGTALPIDPGDHTLEASAPGKITWQSHVQISPESSNDVKIPDLADTPKGSGGGTVTTPADSGKGNTQRVLGLIVAGAGVVAVGIGSGFGIDAASKKGVVDDPNFCLHRADGKVACNAAGSSQLDSANTSAALATVLFVVGGTMVAGGIVLYLAAPKASSEKSVRLAPAPGGLLLSGTF